MQYELMYPSQMNGPKPAHCATVPPPMFCWTKMGAEAGQPLEAILRRKDLERECGDGVFAWGIGNSVGPALDYARRLVRETTLDAFFTPMKSRPKAADAEPTGTVMWRAYRSEDGSVHTLPWHMLVTSRQHAASGSEKRQHFALVCRRDGPLLGQPEPIEIDAACARNLVSNGKLGASQVTAVVKYAPTATEEPRRRYSVLFRATLTRQVFIRLLEPVPLEGRLAGLYEAACESAVAAEWRVRILALREAAASVPMNSAPAQVRMFSTL